MKTPLFPQTLTSPGAFCTPRAIAAATWAATVGEDRYWYERDMSIDELAASVATVNAASRASRK